MKRRALPFALTTAGFGAVASVCAFLACEDPHLRTEPGQGNPVTGCSVKAGETPPATCDDSDGECDGTGGCTINEAKCGSASTCLPMADNKGKDVLDFRIRRLNVATPDALKSKVIRDGVLTNAINLGTKECSDKSGTGDFTWLVRVDKKAGTLTTGGAALSTDIFGLGYCFANTTVGALRVEPAVFPITFQGNTFGSTTNQRLNVPIFSSITPDVIILPLSDVKVAGVTLSEEGNCIGKFRKTALGADCSENADSCSKWQTAGALSGYITLEDADLVLIPQTSSSLCTLLTQSTKGADNKCQRQNGVIVPKGDYCSKDKKPGSCQDSVWLAATFAAAAVHINDGTGVPQCAPLPAGDGGTDAAVSDAGTDAPTDAPAE